jgi:hypothetical protein
VWTLPKIMEDLKTYGSKVRGSSTKDMVSHIPGLTCETVYVKAADAEGIIIWNNETRTRTKMLLKDDAFHKWEVK